MEIPFRITIFCPKLYFKGALNTWADTDLFERLHCTADQAQLVNSSANSFHLLKLYPWGFQKQAALPYGFDF